MGTLKERKKNMFAIRKLPIGNTLETNIVSRYKIRDIPVSCSGVPYCLLWPGSKPYVQSE